MFNQSKCLGLYKPWGGGGARVLSQQSNKVGCKLVLVYSCSVSLSRPEGDPDPILIHDFEDILLSAGGVRCWSGERITSPLVLGDSFPYYRKWCRVKADIDPDLVRLS